MAIAYLVADFEVFAFHAGSSAGFFIRDGEQAGVNGTTGGDGSGDDVFDEFAA